MNGKGIMRQLELASFTVLENTKGMSDEQALELPAGGGSSVNWVLGHIVFSRNMLLKTMGLKMVGAEWVDRLYGRGARPAAAGEAKSLTELLDAYRSTRKPILQFLEEATDGALDQPLETPSELLGDTVGSALVTLSWHEGYHAGQLGTLRRMVGLDGAIQ